MDDEPGEHHDWSEAEISRLLEREFGRVAERISPLGGELFRNLSVRCADGSRLVVKVAPADVDIEVFGWQQGLARHLNALDDAPRAPQVVPTKDGSRFVMVEHEGIPRLICAQEWLPGETLAQLTRQSPQLLREWGRTAGQLVASLPQEAPDWVKSRTHHWDVLRAPESIRLDIAAVTASARIAAIERALHWFEEAVGSRTAQLPKRVVHQDLNDFNLLAQRDSFGCFHVTGVLDFTDALYTVQVAELAVAVAYAMLRKGDPLAAAAQVVAGFHEVVALNDLELSLIYPLAVARLCVNAVTWTAREPANGQYARARMRHTWTAIERLVQLPPALAEAWLRDAIGAGGTSPAETVETWVTGNREGLVPAVEPAPRAVDRRLGADQENESSSWSVFGRHLTTRDGTVARRTTDAGEPATINLGLDVRLVEGTSVTAPLAGTVEPSIESTELSALRTGLVLRHEPSRVSAFWSRWDGIETALVGGQTVDGGDPIGTTDGELLRVCLFTSRDAAFLAPADLVTPGSVPAWRAISPDPTGFIGAVDHGPAPFMDADQVVRIRRRHFAGSQRLYYDTPMKLVRSNGTWLYDEDGFGYLDSINNVSHVGHANRAVARAAALQMQRLNTNSRFLYEGIARYSSRLASLLPDPLEVVFLVCSGSEANDLALRIARQVTGRADVLVIDGAYHGNTGAVTDISPNRYKGRGGAGRPATTHEVVQPNRYRGPFRDDLEIGAKCAAAVSAEVSRLQDVGTPPAAFFAESLMGTAGTIVLPDGYLASAFAAVRAAGGVCVSDEVQVGFGRLGDAFWGFESQGVVPDIVTMGKPIGNGHPLAAVVTTREIADAFDSGMKYFNTFGGNPVSCAVGMSVLDEIRDHELQAAAKEVGAHFIGALHELRDRHALVGEVRGRGLYLGVELVLDRELRTPATVEARYVSERMMQEGVITYPTGDFDNVLKIKPPLVFGRSDADLFAEVLDDVLGRAW